jgi:hypothetical protein
MTETETRLRATIQRLDIEDENDLAELTARKAKRDAFRAEINTVLTQQFADQAAGARLEAAIRLLRQIQPMGDGT